MITFQYIFRSCFKMYLVWEINQINTSKVLSLHVLFINSGANWLIIFTYSAVLSHYLNTFIDTVGLNCILLVGCCQHCLWKPEQTADTLQSRQVIRLTEPEAFVIVLTCHTRRSPSLNTSAGVCSALMLTSSSRQINKLLLVN